MKKVGILFILFALALGAKAQTITMRQPLGSGGGLSSDTVTNAATNYLTGTVSGYKNVVTVQVVVTKISGTVGGTISLLGSADGTNYKALNTRETQTALPTITATDASNVYHWRIAGNDFAKYRVSWTGTGTMAASFSAVILAK